MKSLNLLDHNKLLHRKKYTLHGNRSVSSSFHTYANKHIWCITKLELENASFGGSGRLYRTDDKFNSQDLDKIEGEAHRLSFSKFFEYVCVVHL